MSYALINLPTKNRAQEKPLSTDSVVRNRQSLPTQATLNEPLRYRRQTAQTRPPQSQPLSVAETPRPQTGYATGVILSTIHRIVKQLDAILEASIRRSATIEREISGKGLYHAVIGCPVSRL
jgi:hypothetical protein